MKNPVFFFLLPCFILSSCACPRRAAEATRVIENFRGRPDGLVLREIWRDVEKGGGQFLFADPDVQSMIVLHTNQNALGGGSVFAAGALTITVDTNTAPVLGAVGTAVGNIIGAAAKTAVK
jgi:hypothetical protein